MSTEIQIIKDKLNIIEVFPDPKAFISAIETRQNNAWAQHDELKLKKTGEYTEASKVLKGLDVSQAKANAGTVDIILAFDKNCAVSQDNFSEYLKNAKDFIRSVEAQGIGVNLYASFTFADKFIGFGNNCIVKIKNFDQDLDLDKLSDFALKNMFSSDKPRECPLSGMAFRWYETFPNSTKLPGYGMPLMNADHFDKKLKEQITYRSVVEDYLKDNDICQKPFVVYCKDKRLTDPAICYKALAEKDVAESPDVLRSIVKGTFGVDEFEYAPPEIEEDRER